MENAESKIRIENYTYKMADNIKPVSRSPVIRTAYDMFPDFSRSCLAEEFIIFICNEGRGFLSICGRQYKMEAGSAACILPDDFFSFRSSERKINSGDFFCSCTIIFVPYDSIDRDVSALMLLSRTFVKDAVISQRSNHIDFIPAKYIKNSSHSSVLSDTYIKNAVENILIEILTHSAKTRKYLSLFTYGNQYLTDAAVLIHRNFKNSDLSLDTLAYKVNYHPQHLSKNFIRLFKKGICVYTKEIRLHYAASLAASGYLMIKDISERCFVKSPSYLTKEFIREYNITPSEYRKKYS